MATTRPQPRPAAAPPVPHLRHLRLPLADGAQTTLHVAAYPADRWDLRVVRLRRPQPLEAWCAAHGVQEALVGGFFVRDGRGTSTPLGELRTRGVARRSEPFAAPWGAVRACLHIARGEPAIAWRHELPAAPRGDLLQAGPLLVRDGRPVAVEGTDEEGFAAAAHQFDSDITDGRHPRAALAVAPRAVLAVTCDGRAPGDAGLTLGELARVLSALGARAAINLDGGGSASLVCGGHLRNVPRERHGVPLPAGRPVTTAIAFTPNRRD